MYRRLLPENCPQCGAAVPRAAASRCPACRHRFGEKPVPPTPAPLRIKHHAEGGNDAG